MLAAVEGERTTYYEQPGRQGRSLTDIPRIKRDVTLWLYQEVGGIVQTGPFAGMKILLDTAWPDTYLPPLLLGCYEEELHGEIERQISRLSKLPNPKISVVGCAEGYYAIGFKRRIPHATVYATDSDDRCLAICARAAAANDVQLVRGAPVEVILDADLIFMDVEGAEVVYLDPDRVPSLRDRYIMVELHDFGEKQATPQIIADRFRGSHRITMLLSGGPRVPSSYVWLCAMHSDYQWLAVSEGRPCLMSWYAMQPKGVVLS